MSETSSACAMPADLMPPNFDAILEFAFLNANCHSIHFLFYGFSKHYVTVTVSLSASCYVLNVKPSFIGNDQRKERICHVLT